VKGTVAGGVVAPYSSDSAVRTSARSGIRAGFPRLIRRCSAPYGTFALDKLQGSIYSSLPCRFSCPLARKRSRQTSWMEDIRGFRFFRHFISHPGPSTALGGSAREHRLQFYGGGVWLMKKRGSHGLAFILLTLVACVSVSEQPPGPNSPTIRNFRFVPNEIKRGESLKYVFEYENFAGGLAAVQESRMWMRWKRAGLTAVRSPYAPAVSHMARHTQPSGRYESPFYTWDPSRTAGFFGSDVEYTLELTAPGQRAVQASALLRFVP
jgi:hypothetical protein